MKEQSEANRELLKAMVEGSHAMRSSNPDSRDAEESVSLLSGLDCQTKLPVFKQSDTDIEKHFREFELTLNCKSYSNKGRPKKIMDDDWLRLLRSSLAVGTPHRVVYDTEYDRAEYDNRLPAETSPESQSA